MKVKLNSKERKRMKNLDKHYNRIIHIYDNRFGDRDPYEKVVADKRHKYIERERGGHNIRVLDLGCGTGIYLSHLLDISRKVYACDLSSLMINRAKNKYKNVKFAIASADRLPYPNKHFDVVFCLNSFYHFNNQKKALKEISRVLKKGGVAYIEIFNIFHPFVLLAQPTRIFRSITLKANRAGGIIKYCKTLKMQSHVEIMSFVENSSTVQQFLPPFLSKHLKKLERIKFPKLFFFRGMLICKKI